MNYLLDLAESKLFVDILRVSDAKSTRPGVTDEPWCRLARQFVRQTAEYFITRYGAWRGISFKPTAAA